MSLVRFITTAVAVALVGTTAQAYVLPADFLVKLLAEKRKGQKITDLSLQMTVERLSVGDTIDEHLFLGQGAKLRRVHQSEDGEVFVQNEARYATGSESKLRGQKGACPDLTADLFVPGLRNFDGIALRTLEHFKQVGIDTTVTALGRNGEDIVYIIGARPFERDKPQVWLNKKTLLPVRWQARIKVDGQDLLHEARYSEYGSAVAGDWYPRVIEEYRNGTLYRRAEVVQAKVNQKLPETLFAIP